MAGGWREPHCCYPSWYEIETAHVDAAVRARIVDLRRLPPPEIGARTKSIGEPRIFITDAVMADVSATQIRECAGNARLNELASMVPAPVADYLLKYELYKSE